MVDRRARGLSDEEIRKRFHEIGVAINESLGKFTVALELEKQRMSTFELTLATKANNDLVVAAMDHLRDDFRLVRNVVFGLIGVIVVSVIASLMTGVLRTSP